jgi:hypothetical protein
MGGTLKSPKDFFLDRKKNHISLQMVGNYDNKKEDLLSFKMKLSCS